MAVLRCLRCSPPAGDAAGTRPGILDFPTSSLPSDDNSAGTPRSDGESFVLSSQSSIPSVRSLQRPSPDCLAGFEMSSASSTRIPGGAVHSLAVSASSLLAGTASAALFRFQNPGDLTEPELLTSSSDEGAVKCIAVAAATIFTAHQDGKIRVWELTGRLRRVASLPTASDRAFRFLLPRNHVPVRRHRSSLWIDHVDAVSALAARNGLLYSVSWDRTLKIWRLSDFRCIESVRAHDDAVNALAVSDDGTVYTGSADTRVRVWARSDGQKKHSLVATLEAHRSAVNALALSSDGSILYSGACDRSILVWEREESAQHMLVAGALRGHTRAVLCLEVASGLLVSGSADRTVRVWRRGIDNQYSSVAVLEGHERPVKSLAVSAPKPASGSVLIYSGSLDGEVKAWWVRGPSLEDTDSPKSGA
ncbi:Myosin heavy chain kinase B [Nymphaea thermarum]|nr:Myosin heavy chain kinase B [Nymphaea thermarum]